MSTTINNDFKSILIANRGEIACRVIATARKMGYKTVAVYSEPDKHARHVQMADLAVAIGGNTSRESYLDAAKIIEACKASGADAVHPGYGFLSENAEFARSCQDSGIVFIGPTAHAIDAMGNKSRSKELMLEAGVPCIPGYQGPDQDVDNLLAQADKIGFPIMVKAAAGGGGRGLRLANNHKELAEQLISARKEAESSFGSGELLLERALTQARHVEVQVFGDNYGNVVHLGERDCSVQRRHQKVLEESPSPAVDEKLRDQMGQAAVLAAKAISYMGAGTVEFLLDKDGRFYFLEMNTRLQVEHPVTEEITKLDLVEWQLAVAAGQQLPLKQSEITFSGHAMEARLYAEDPQSDFLPQVGAIHHWQPAPETLARTDHGLHEKSEVSPYYDPMLAKVIVWGKNRGEAVRKLAHALGQTTIAGIKTNREFLLACLQQDEFVRGQADTSFIGKFWNPDSSTPSPYWDTPAIAAAILLSESMRDLPPELAGWSSNGRMHSVFELLIDGSGIHNKSVCVKAEFLSAQRWHLTVGNETFDVAISNKSAITKDTQSFKVSVNHLTQETICTRTADAYFISTPNSSHKIIDITFAPVKTKSAESSGILKAPGNGLIASVDVQLGDIVEKGQIILTLEAMKLLQTIYAPAGGVVKNIAVSAGQQVKTGQILIEIEPQGTPEAMLVTGSSAHN